MVITSDESLEEALQQAAFSAQGFAQSERRINLNAVTAEGSTPPKQGRPRGPKGENMSAVSSFLGG